MSAAKPGKFVVVYRGSSALLTQYTLVELAEWDGYHGYKVISSGNYPEIRDLVKRLNEAAENE